MRGEGVNNSTHMNEYVRVSVQGSIVGQRGQMGGGMDYESSHVRWSDYSCATKRDTRTENPIVLC